MTGLEFAGGVYGDRKATVFCVGEEVFVSRFPQIEFTTFVVELFLMEITLTNEVGQCFRRGISQATGKFRMATTSSGDLS